jgi:hypothetical protein
MKKISLQLFIAASVFISACDSSEQSTKAVPPKEDKIAIGTDIKTLAKPKSEQQKQNVVQQVQQENQQGSEQGKEQKADDKSGAVEYQKISWEDLEIPGQGMDEVLEKFEKEIESIPEGSLKEKEVMGRLQAALNSAPVNPELDKKKIKLSGFVSPLEIDEKLGVVKEFLLVPYYGACIHVPPPPLNQTLLIKPAKDQQIKLEDAYDPIWVTGVIHAESTITKLAEAGYKITDVKIEPYTEHLQE